MDPIDALEYIAGCAALAPMPFEDHRRVLRATRVLAQALGLNTDPATPAPKTDEATTPPE